MANIVNFTDKQFENRLNDNLEELVQGKKAVELKCTPNIGRISICLDGMSSVLYRAHVV